MLFAVGFTEAKAVVTVEKIRIIAASRYTALFAEKCIYVSVSFYKCFLHGIFSRMIIVQIQEHRCRRLSP